MINNEHMEQDPCTSLSAIIRNFVRHSPENTLGNESAEPAWQEPLIGFSRGDDPLYDSLKADIGDFFWTPREIFQITFNREPDALSVIAWILPQTEVTKEDNRKEKTYPAERWSRSRHFGEMANRSIAFHVVQKLNEAGIDAVAPELSPHWQWQTSERYGYASKWSNRHAAYVAGLGTFGLCDGLITARGKAIRCGSVVAGIDIKPTPRNYKDHRGYCLFYSHNGKCGKCISRCPVGALSEAGHDKVRCRDYLFEVLAEHSQTRYGFASYGCGLCQTGVPCESRIPLVNDL